MDKVEMTRLLERVAAGELSPEDAALKLKMQPFQEIGEYAKVDFHRGIRQGVPEVIYGAGKAKEHILGIAKAMLENGQKTVLITRLTPEAAELLQSELPL
ncbi:MAG: 1-(5-phosphoribosyl)-5-amino-4-imidazole-carboxylate carboxylase, partial [Oscillospiraceae bacterium]|nr:1-(5-phosphoribosyl)-5-amino-4-imidazole-carboxylate carboxylase [Oscillospiraceae bacterium]